MNNLKRAITNSLTLESRLPKELFAEFLGTTFLMALGIGCSMSNTLSRGVYGNIMSQDIGWGLTVAFAVIISGGITGGHLNPSISITFALLGELQWMKVPLYILAQLLGAFVGSAFAYGIYYDALNAYDSGFRVISGANATANLFATYPQDFLSAGSGFANEVFATCVLMICVMAICDKKNMAIPTFLMPLFVGLTILLINCSYCYNSGCAMNPARDFGPRVFTSIAGWGGGVFSFRNYNWFWVPILGPVCGAPIGAMVYTFFIGLHIPRDPSPYANDKHTIQMQSSVDTDYSDGRYIRSASTISDKTTDTAYILPNHISK
jgi:MIP family channel proteins